MPDPLTVSAWVLAASIEQDLIAVEAADGYNVAFASRPLNKAEKAAKTRFGDLDAIVTTNTELSIDIIGALYAAAIAAVLTEVFTEGEDADGDGEPDEDAVVEVATIVAALYLLRQRERTSYTTARDKAAPKLQRLIEQSYTGGVATVLDEAKRQGVDIEKWKRPPVPDALAVLGPDVADHPWERVTDRAITEFTNPGRAMAGTVTRGELEKFMEDTSQAGTVDRMHQANQVALGVGRIEAAQNYAGEFLVAYASEIMDKATCGSCSSVDGRRYDTLEEAEEDYPFGIYVKCQGGSRCRGTLVVVFGNPDDESE